MSLLRKALRKKKPQRVHPVHHDIESIVRVATSDTEEKDILESLKKCHYGVSKTYPKGILKKTQKFSCCHLNNLQYDSSSDDSFLDKLFSYLHDYSLCFCRMSPSLDTSSISKRKIRKREPTHPGLRALKKQIQNPSRKTTQRRPRIDRIITKQTQ